MKTLDMRTNFKQAISASAYAAGLLTGTKIDATGFGRAKFIFSFGGGGLTGSISTGIMIYNATAAASSSGTWNTMPTAVLAAVTSGAMSGNQYMAYIDTAIKDGYPWLLVSALSVLSTTMNLSVIVELYEGTRKYAPTQTPTQTVVV